MIKFIRHPDIALNAGEYYTGKYRMWYSNDYDAIFKAVAEGRLEERDVLRSLFANDLWFLVRYGMQIEKAQHPFVVEICRMVETGPATMTLDVWAREHFKSAVITQAETLQYHIKNPEYCTGIFAYSRPAAKAFLRSIKILCEQSDLLQWCFPEVLWKRPEVEAPKWSEDDGLIFKRSSNARKESTIEAWGLIEGMPTGRHFERRVYDDVETDDIRDSPDMLSKCFSKFEMSDNLGVDGGVERVIGTYYSHFGPMVKIRDKKDLNGNLMYQTRLRPATDDGSRDGKPVLFSQERLDKLKMSVFFNSQQLCDPTPSSEVKLSGNYLKAIEPQFIPRNIHKFMILDQAGGDETDKQNKDLWSYGVMGIEPVMDDIGQSNVYLLDIEADKMSHSEGIDGVVRMYLRNGIIQQMGVEKVGLSTTEIHITNALRIKGRRLALDAGNLVLLKPAGRSKERRVEMALQWPLNNGKIYYSTAIPRKYIDAIMEEMQKFPFYHVDILDMLAYSYDMFKEFKFPHSSNVVELLPKDEDEDDPLHFGMPRNRYKQSPSVRM
jgi:hypothetical protein